MSEAVIVADGVRVEFEGHVVFADISFEIQPGEIFTIIGPSGHGKSVLLKTLAGVIHPDGGHVRIKGRDWEELEEAERRELCAHAGMLFQKGALFDSMSVLDNVIFPLREHENVPEDEYRPRAMELLEGVGLADAIEKFPYELSGGMQRRLGIARALALEPEIVFYDDPTAGQDPITGDKIGELLLELKRKNNSTLIMVTNEMPFAFRMSDRIALLADHRLIEIGTPEQIKTSKNEAVQQFIHGKLKGPLTNH